MTLVLIRHGQAESNAAGVIGGARDYPLTEAGRDQARAAARRLAGTQIDAIYASDLSRASETASFIAELAGLEEIEHPALRERSWGDAEGLTREQIAERFGTGVPRGQGLIPNEETHHTFLARVAPVFRELHDRHREERVLVVAHAGTILAVLSEIIGLAPARMPRFSIENTSFTTIEGTDPPSLGAINDHAHL
jgi:uncharacterized phosphatase